MGTSRRFEAHPQSAAGDFYVVNHECASCGAPHVVAPNLIGWAEEPDNHHCIWKKQPETVSELLEAFATFDVSDLGCHRYAGNDPAIMNRIGPDCCDQAKDESAALAVAPAEFRVTMLRDHHAFISRLVAALSLTGLVVFLFWRFGIGK